VVLPQIRTYPPAMVSQQVHLKKLSQVGFSFIVYCFLSKCTVDVLTFNCILFLSLQVQISYTLKNGMRCLRVLSTSHEVTKDRKQMEEVSNCRHKMRYRTKNKNQKLSVFFCVYLVLHCILVHTDILVKNPSIFY